LKFNYYSVASFVLSWVQSVTSSLRFSWLISPVPLHQLDVTILLSFALQVKNQERHLKQASVRERVKLAVVLKAFDSFKIIFYTFY